MNDLLIESAIRSTVVVSAAWIAWFLRRASADLRQKIWLAALIGTGTSSPRRFPNRLAWWSQRKGRDLQARGILPLADRAGRPVDCRMTLLGRMGLGLVRMARITNEADPWTPIYLLLAQG